MIPMLLTALLLLLAGPVEAVTQEELGLAIVSTAKASRDEADSHLLFVRSSTERHGDEQVVTMEYSGVDGSWQVQDKYGQKAGSCYKRMEAAMRAMDKSMPQFIRRVTTSGRVYWEFTDQLTDVQAKAYWEMLEQWEVAKQSCWRQP